MAARWRGCCAFVTIIIVLTALVVFIALTSKSYTCDLVHEEPEFNLTDIKTKHSYDFSSLANFAGYIKYELQGSPSSDYSGRGDPGRILTLSYLPINVDFITLFEAKPGTYGFTINADCAEILFDLETEGKMVRVVDISVSLTQANIGSDECHVAMPAIEMQQDGYYSCQSRRVYRCEQKSLAPANEHPGLIMSLVIEKLEFEIDGDPDKIRLDQFKEPAPKATETSEPGDERLPEDWPDQEQETAGPSQEPGTSRLPDIEPRGNKPATITNQHVNLDLDSQPPIDENTMKECEECHLEFLRSYLYRNFGTFICDDCRDPRGTHELITRTDAKAKYILKDCDLDLRKPPLRYILKKNPYQSRGDMRLYLKYQIEERALQVHGSEEQLEEELEKREERRIMKKQKVYDKKMKTLSMQVRSSLYKRNISAHEHEYGDAECINEDADLYRKTCKTCGYQWEYEEL